MTRPQQTTAALLLTVVAGLASGCENTPVSASAAPTAEYEITFESLWTAESHPRDYPSANAHFSGLIGATHAADFVLFAEGRLPTPGLERLSEMGKHSPLDAEIGAAIGAGTAGALFTTEALWTGSQTTSVKVNREFPRLSAVAMIAPSPDWFAGAADVALFEDGNWLERKEVLMYAWDAGGDSGTTYQAPDADLDPKQPTRQSKTSFFVRDGRPVPVARLTFELQ